MVNRQGRTANALGERSFGGGVAELDPRYEFYQDVMRALERAQVPFLIGGGFAFTYYTDIKRKTKDLDLFLLPQDFTRAMEILAGAGFDTMIRFPHWLGKALKGEDFVDIIYSSGNGLCRVDETWFDHAVPVEILGLPVRLCPPEEMIWSKAFVMERDRFDGADVAHLIRSCSETLDWRRLFRLFHNTHNTHWRVLFSHLILFGYIFPCEQSKIPDWVQNECLQRYRQEMKNALPGERICRGTLLSWSEYLPDVEQQGYGDGRNPPGGTLSPEETIHLTALWRQGEPTRGPKGEEGKP